VWLLLYGSYALSRPPLPDGPATIHAEVAREMLTRSDWATAYVNGFPVASSSRTLDWSIAASYKIFGISDWAARLPIALCVLLLAFTAYFFGRMLFGWNAAGLYAALIVLVWPGTFLATRNLSEAPIVSLVAAIVAWVLWQLLVVRQLELWSALAVSAVAALLVFLICSWPGMILPLSVVLICWMVRLFAPTGDRPRWMLASWAAASFIIASLSMDSHVQPQAALLWLAAAAPLGLLAGGWLANHEAFSNPAPSRRVAQYIFAIGLVVAAIAVFFAIHGPVGFSVSRTSVAVTAGSSRVPLLIFALALIAGVSGNLIFRLRKNKARIANCFLAGALGGIIVAIQAGMVIGSPRSSSQILAEAIRPELNPTDVVVIDGKYADASSLAFYLERPISLAVPAPTNSPSFLPATPRGTTVLSQVWGGPARVFLWTRIERPLPVPGKSFIIATSGGKEILSNQPNAGGASF
jgi:hypothetical protein